MSALHVVLVEPLIPQNTGTVGRLCVATATTLHLVRPLGFDISEKAVKRAGLDYWPLLDLVVHEDIAACQGWFGARWDTAWLFSARAARPYTAARFEPGAVLVFGKETTGLPAALVDSAGERTLSVPLFGPVRSLNLSMTVGIAVYEGLRQLRPDRLPAPGGTP